MPMYDKGILGAPLPQDRLYHRGHTWVRREEDGTYNIGLDDFIRRLIGNPDLIELPCRVRICMQTVQDGYEKKEQAASACTDRLCSAAARID